MITSSIVLLIGLLTGVVAVATIIGGANVNAYYRDRAIRRAHEDDKSYLERIG